MNAFVLRSVQTVVLLTFGLCSFAQEGKGSLTEEFPKLSAKERSRIAAKETREAQEDAAYQREMLGAEAAFQAKNYEEALAGYERARALRPYNVYPKVKIEDLRALLGKQESAAAPTPVPRSTVAEPAAPPSPSGPPSDHSPAAPSVPVPTPEVPVRVGAAPDRSAPVVVDKPKPSPKPAPAPAPVREGSILADGIHERQYQEGRAFVVERTVVEEGNATVYKRVIHPAGHTFYFQDGRSVDERVWRDRFERR